MIAARVSPETANSAQLFEAPAGAWEQSLLPILTEFMLFSRTQYASISRPLIT